MAATKHPKNVPKIVNINLNNIQYSLLHSA
jgi:hypothetical protein